MKNKFVILMLALLCLSCTGKSPKNDSPDSAEDVQNLPRTVSLEFWETFSAPENGTNPRRTSVITSKMGDADKAVEDYIANETDPKKKDRPTLLQVLNVYNAGGGIVGYVDTEAKAELVSEYLALPRVAACFPKEVIFMWGSKPDKSFDNMFLLYAIYDEDADGKAPLDGSVVKEARANYSQYGFGEVLMTMNGEGSRKWANITEANKGMNIAIVLDGCVYSAPRVVEKIECGRCSISGDFTMEEAEKLANSLTSHE